MNERIRAWLRTAFHGALIGVASALWVWGHDAHDQLADAKQALRDADTKRREEEARREQASAAAAADLKDQVQTFIAGLRASQANASKRIEDLYAKHPVLPPGCVRPGGVYEELEAARQRANRAATGEL